MVYWVISLSLIVIVLGYITINLFRKVVKQEKIMASYLEYLDSISRIIEFSDEKLKQSSLNEAFSNDDEIGFFFQEIKKIQKLLNNFNIRKQ